MTGPDVDEEALARAKEHRAYALRKMNESIRAAKGAADRKGDDEVIRLIRDVHDWKMILINQFPEVAGHSFWYWYKVFHRFNEGADVIGKEADALITDWDKVKRDLNDLETVKKGWETDLKNGGFI